MCLSICLHVCLCTTHPPGTYGDLQASDLLELELRTAVGRLMSARNQSLSLEELSALNSQAISPALNFKVLSVSKSLKTEYFHFKITCGN